jgi:hypothetical protein
MLGWLLRILTPVPERLMVAEVHYLLDGGTTIVLATDEKGQRRSIPLTQHLFEQRGGVGWLYLDRYRVPRRTDTERAIVRLLRGPWRSCGSTHTRIARTRSQWPRRCANGEPCSSGRRTSPNWQG